MSDRKEVLSDFKSCTGINDDAKATSFLEAANWDLLEAVSKVVSDESQKLPSEVESATINEFVPVKTSRSSVNSNSKVSVHTGVKPCSSDKKIRFIITNDDNAKNPSIYQFELSENGTIHALKELIRAESEIPVCHQLLVGWPGPEPSDTDEIGLLDLPDVVNLNLFSVINTDKSSETSNNTRDEIYTLKIHDQNLDKVYTVTYTGSNRILDVKQGIFSLTDIPFSQQEWTGWPENTNDNTTLALSGINFPEHHLAIKASTDSVAHNNNKHVKRSMSQSDSEESMTPFEDDDEDKDEEEDDENDDMHSVDDDIPFDTDFSTTNNVQPLIPEHFENESGASVCFAYEFENRYGTLHPHFFVGTLDEALKESCFRPARERKLLAMYLHHDRSVLTNVFCTQLLCFDSVIQYLANNFVLWGWDLTSNSNKEHLLRIVSEKLGSMASDVIRSTKLDRMPILVIFTKARGNTEILTTITGNVTLNELISSLIQAVDMFMEQRSVEVLEEDDRERRELIKVEQDEAYRQSLERDRAKEEAKRKEEELEKERLNEIINAKRQEEEKKEATRMALQSQLPPEPVSDNEFVTKIRIRLPTNAILERKFLVSEKFQVLLNYLVVNGFQTSEYKLCTIFPRRDLTLCNADATLKQLNLFPQETLVIERR